jgi:RsiW-degrading membrane proteinase PrsW (M82 family)
MSWPVAIAGAGTILSLIALLVVTTRSAVLGIALGLVPLVLVLPVLAWLDRVEPEPLRSRVHAVLWGATVAGLVSGLVNSVVAVQAGEVWAAVASAPLIEEATKGLGVYWAVRRREVDGVMDGIVYGGWVALGFAVVEDFLYFTTAVEAGQWQEVFVVRALLTPFAHPLFTAWIGLAIGLAVSRQQSLLLNAAWGYGLAVASHSAWNASLAFSGEQESVAVIVVAAGAFFLLFIVAAVTVTGIRRHDQRRFTETIPFLAYRYGMSSHEIEVFGNWKTVLSSRRSLPRSRRKYFDEVHSALARLALFHRRQGPADEATEYILTEQLRLARQAQSAV